MGENVGCYTSLGDEAVEGEEIGVSGVAEEGGHDGIAGEDSRAAVRVDGVASEKSRLTEIVIVNQF